MNNKNIKKLHSICILPTGDWAEINEKNQVQYKTLTEKEFKQLCNEEIALCDLD